MKLYFQCVIIAALLITAWVTTATAALQCNGCHGTSNPVDFRPLDSIFRNPSTGGFSGNHRTHLDSPASSTACSICHPGSGSFTSSHRDGKLKISSRINNSPNTTYYPAYDNNTSAWSQTATPAMGACANVNCHFETISPVWASAPELTTCSTCHGAFRYGFCLLWRCSWKPRQTRPILSRRQQLQEMSPGQRHLCACHQCSQSRSENQLRRCSQ